MPGPNDEKYVAIPDCTVIQQTVRSLEVECPHFPENASGKRRIHIHLALLNTVEPVPEIGETGTIVVNDRLIKAYPNIEVG